MKVTDEHNERVAKMKFASIYPHYVSKIEKKGRTIDELHTVIEWLTGFDSKKIQEVIDRDLTYKEFFDEAELNPNAHLITGSICGYKIQDIDNELTKKSRYLDKVVDELAKGKKIEKIMRQPA